MLLRTLTSLFKRPEPQDLLARARQLRRDDAPEQARQLCMEILRETPRDAQAMALLAALAADQGQAQAGLQWVRQALAVDPDCLQAHFALGRLHEGQERFAQAEASYRRVVQLDDSYAMGHTNLGCMLHLRGDLQAAAECYRKALTLDPAQPEALRNYALVAGTPQQLREAMLGFERHVSSHPRDARALHQLAHLYLHLGRHDDALVHYERALALEPDEAEFHFARGQLLLQLGRYEEGWREYEWRWRMDYLNGPMRRFPQPRWDGRPLPGTLLVHGESGFGDVFQLIRYVPLAARRCGRVVVECSTALHGLVSRIEGVAQVVPEGGPLPPFDAHIPPIAMPPLFGAALADVPWEGPYIQADASRVADWAARVAAAAPHARKVGVVWTGNPGNLGNRERSVTLQQLALLADLPDLSFFSLQKGVGDLARPGAVPEGMHFVDLTADLADFSDTAALIANLDLVISIDTSVAHLAGAMGRPVWVLLPFAADWRYHVDRSDNPWYPSMRLFRQQSEGDWSAPLQELRRALAALPAGAGA
jgi:tetratricopeptide (TPR) repeat protein